ncbi:ROK family transcriptional regulator [Streptomyces justiciae]|uniref:ROK family transcriptional regulator n=1 Tax=Streptomyces justiciae TaxID=2780140 RepID=A0ABU3M757_9ACTN|nr:ROK family transcriptional regulator [Streptomyces justiciae]MDT7847270.1 ROK family transcriptional regulator [Streptomyces justiciae]
MSSSTDSPADATAVRRGNLSLVLRQVAARGPCARTEIAAVTGLAHATVTALVADLMARGLIREDGAAATGGRGRPRRRLRLVPERVRTVAVHATWEGVEVVTADLSGELVDVGYVPQRGPFGPRDLWADAIAAAVKPALEPGAGRHLGSLVIAVAGPVTRGPARPDPPRLGASAATLEAMVAERLPGVECPVVVANDADMAAVAEYHALLEGRAEPPDSIAYIKSDAGVAGGLVIDGRIHRGSHGLAGSFGHLPVSLDGPRCGCGGRGCLNSYLSTGAVFEAAGLDGLAADQGKNAALAELDLRLRGGEPDALTALDRAGHALGAAIQAVAAATDVDEFVLGGHLAAWAPWLTPGVDIRLGPRRAAFPAVPLRVTPGVLGLRATLHGAVRTGHERVLADPGSVPPG